MFQNSWYCGPSMALSSAVLALTAGMIPVSEISRWGANT
jgi:hypothetical protein